MTIVTHPCDFGPTLNKCMKQADVNVVEKLDDIIVSNDDFCLEHANTQLYGIANVALYLHRIGRTSTFVLTPLR